MAAPARAKRFRVALSFPGEHRARVEKIAEELGRRLGRDKVLCYPWYVDEFNRPDLDTYLARLYHDESDLIAVFLCKQYNAKPWCGLEWRACRDLMAHRPEVRLMFFRLDDADIPGLYSIDGYQDIQVMTDTEVAAAILTQSGEAPRRIYRAFTSRLPLVNPTLIGREEQIAFLDRAWADPDANFVQIIAAGGTGKTALVDKWFRLHLSEADIFGWSFYSQGTSPDRQTSSDPFFTEFLSWLHAEIAPTASVYAKAEVIAHRLREQRMLLILDGVEPLQDGRGELRDAALKALLQELGTSNRGLVVCTTRVRIEIPDDPPRALSINLENLTSAQGAEYLRTLKVEGPHTELERASLAYGNHALALTLLETFLADFHDHNVYGRYEIRGITDEEGNLYDRARHVMAAYDRMFAGKAEAEILRALGYFDRPAEPDALKLVMPSKNDRKYRSALKRLQDARLVLTNETTRHLDCHPLIREHFAADATREGHLRLYRHYANRATYWPDTLEKMMPLFHAVYHGCHAGQHNTSLEDIYWDRIQRRNEFYLTRSLGALGTNLSLLANFFEIPWTRPVATLAPASQLWLIGLTGTSLRGVGRIAEAFEPMQAGAEAYVNLRDWLKAAVRYGDLSEFHLTLGNIGDALAAARQSVDLADRSCDEFQRVSNRAKLAACFHQSGDRKQAMHLFVEAERLQAENEPEHPILYSLAGYLYCDLLFEEGRTKEVLYRASETLRMVESEGWLLDIGLDHLSLGRAHLSGSVEAKHHLNQAVSFLRHSGYVEFLALGLLARGKPHDLEEVLPIATHSGMRLHLTDYHLAMARHDPTCAWEHFKKAELLVHETGYHRRDGELNDLRTKLG